MRHRCQLWACGQGVAALGMVMILVPALSACGGNAPYPTPTTSPGPPTSTIVAIESLRDEQLVPSAVFGIQGISINLKGQELWLVLIVRGIPRFYPQDGPAIVQDDGDWTSPSVFFGGEEDVGRRFDVIAVVANDRAGMVFRKYLEVGQQTKEFPGLRSLPKGVVEYDRITVIRV